MRRHVVLPARGVLLINTDVHGFLALANDTAGTRVTETFSTSGGNQTVPLGPAAAQPTITFGVTTPYLRPRAQAPMQSEYASEIEVFFAQGIPARTASVLASSERM